MSSRKRNNRYFANYSNKKRKDFVLEPGMIGFLCTCNFNEKACITDAYKLLNQFADEEYGTGTTQVCKESETPITLNRINDKSSEDLSKDEDISTALDKEINQLKTEYEAPIPSRRFQVVDSGVKNIIFVKTTLPNPLELVTKIITELDASKKQCTRFVLRLLPIEVICKAYMDDIKTKANILFEKYFAQEPKTFSIVFNRHSNNNIKRDEIIEDLAEIIQKKNPGNKADLKNPEIAVVVEVIRGFCLFSIAPNYYKFKKYNLFEICNAKNKTTSNKEAEKLASEEVTEEDSDITVSTTQQIDKSVNKDDNLHAEISE